MYHYLLIGIGGGLGGCRRAGLGGSILHRTVDWRFPISTFFVNVLGCLVAGVLAGLITQYEYFSPQTPVFLFTGLLGGFTTFSAFGLETVKLLRDGAYGVAMSYVLLSVVTGVEKRVWVAMTIVDPACIRRSIASHATGETLPDIFGSEMTVYETTNHHTIYHFGAPAAGCGRRAWRGNRIASVWAATSSPRRVESRSSRSNGGAGSGVRPQICSWCMTRRRAGLRSQADWRGLVKSVRRFPI